MTIALLIATVFFAVLYSRERSRAASAIRDLVTLRLGVETAAHVFGLDMRYASNVEGMRDTLRELVGEEE